MTSRYITTSTICAGNAIGGGWQGGEAFCSRGRAEMVTGEEASQPPTDMWSACITWANKSLLHLGLFRLN